MRPGVLIAVPNIGVVGYKILLVPASRKAADLLFLHIQLMGKQVTTVSRRKPEPKEGGAPR